MPQINHISYFRPLIQNTHSYRLMFGVEKSKQPNRFKCAGAALTALVETIAYGALFLIAKAFGGEEQKRVHYGRFAKGNAAAFFVGLQGIVRPEKATALHLQVEKDLDSEFGELVKQQHRLLQKINKTMRRQHLDKGEQKQHFFDFSGLNQHLLGKISGIVKDLEVAYPKVSKLEKYDTLEDAYAKIHAVLRESKAVAAG